MEKKEQKKESQTVKVTADLKNRRLLTIEGLELAHYRALQAGQAVEVDKSIVEKYPELFKEV